MNIFLSSTCYDLGDLRAEVESFLISKGHKPMLSDRETFPVDPSKHRHEVCLENISKCDLFILVIGKRLGAPYFADESISITWAEFRRAIEKKKKVLAFVRSATWNERQSYAKNNSPEYEYKPAFVDNNKVFEFLNEVQRHESGIWLQSFTDSVQIKTLLENMVDTQHSVLNIQPAPSYFSSLLSPSIFSGATASFISKSLNIGEDTQLDVSQLQKAANMIPDHPIQHTILGFETLPYSNDYTMFQPIRPMGDEGEMLIRIIPTALGNSVKEEIMDTINRQNAK
jgi:hypothetical protein